MNFHAKLEDKLEFTELDSLSETSFHFGFFLLFLFVIPKVQNPSSPVAAIFKVSHYKNS